MRRSTSPNDPKAVVDAHRLANEVPRCRVLACNQLPILQGRPEATGILSKMAPRILGAIVNIVTLPWLPSTGIGDFNTNDRDGSQTTSAL